MFSSKIDLISKYNDVLRLAINSSADFPDKLCEYLIDEFDIQTVVIFKIVENNDFLVLGKSASAKSNYTTNALFSCSVCKSLKGVTETSSFNQQSDCELQTSDFVIYEGCLHVKYGDNEKALIKIAKKAPFTKADRDNIELLGNSLSNLLTLWEGNQLRKDSSLNSLITTIAPELRTPLNSIMGFTSLLGEELLSSSQLDYVSTLTNNAYNLHLLINDLINIASIEEAAVNEMSSGNVKEIVEDAVRQLKNLSEVNSIEFLLNFDDNLPLNVITDLQKLKYILNSLLAWSVRLTEKGKIAVSVSSPETNKLHFRIADSSPGLTSNKVKDFFKPFALSDTAQSDAGKTTGLSLLLVKKYLESLDGIIDITSSIGKGTVYQFTIPTEGMSPIEAQITKLPEAEPKKNRVLVVEDDYATSKLLSNYLTKWGYDPVVVNSAEQALKVVDKESYLAILMDIILPDANGFELLKEMREHKNVEKTPVIICSVEAEQQKAYMMGAVEYFVKPIKYKFLVEVLNRYKLKKDSNVLIVDDDVPTLNLIREAVEQSGYNAIAESHSGRVNAMIDNMDLDLAIIDLDMPEVNGFDLIKQIKSKPNFARLPVIIYTGKENYKEDLKKIDGLFEELLEKSSSNIEDLAETINQMINRYEEPSKPEELLDKKDVIKILLVEDYKHSQIIVTRLLKKNDFDSIVVVENGLEALEEAKRQHYDLILMDMQMPVMNGFEATEKIRLLPEYKDTPIIALTAFAMKGDREKCLDAGANDYIPKPIESQEFIDKVKHYTQMKIKV